MVDRKSTEWTIVPLGKQHDRSTFSCGRPMLDEFIQSRATQYEKRRLGKTFVAIRQGDTRVIGYYTLAAGAVEFERLPSETARKLPRHPVPVVLLARLAVDVSAQGRRLGEALLVDALCRSLELSGKLGVHAIVVDALDEAAASFYGKYGFFPLLDDPLHLFLPLAVVDKQMGKG